MISMIFQHAWIWFVVGFGLIVLETYVAGAYLIWIGLGAVLTGVWISAFPEAGPVLHLGCFILSMTASVFLGVVLQKYAKVFNPTRLNQGLEQYIGKRAVVDQAFENGKGRIQLDGTTYSALSKADLGKGDAVRVERIEDGVFHVVGADA